MTMEPWIGLFFCLVLPLLLIGLSFWAGRLYERRGGVEFRLGWRQGDEGDDL
jgi:hypothetical protein